MIKFGKVKAYIDYNDYNKVHYFEDFDIVDELPKIGDLIDDNKVIKIEEAKLDCEQGSDDVYNYDYYKLTLKYEDYDDTYVMYVCAEKEGEQYED